MNVESSNIAFVFGANDECGKMGRLLLPFDTARRLGRQWVVRVRNIGDAVVVDLHMIPLVLDPQQDPAARELLDRNGRLVWDRWSAPPDVHF